MGRADLNRIVFHNIFGSTYPDASAKVCAIEVLSS